MDDDDRPAGPSVPADPALRELARRFEDERARLRGVAYRILGSAAEADDAVQETWLRLVRTGPGGIDNLAAWLTTVVGRVSLDALRARRDVPLGAGPGGGGGGGGTGGEGGGPDRAEGGAPDPERPGATPEDEAVLADSVGLAMLVVLDTLSPAERVAFVLHDLFSVPFGDIAPILDRTPTAAKKLASRARHRVRGTAARPPADLARSRRLVGAFLAASRRGDVGALLAVLDPDVVRRADTTVLPAGAAAVLRGARAVAEETRTNAARARSAVPVLVGGEVGLVVAPAGRLMAVLLLTTDAGTERITGIDIVADPARLAGLRPRIALLGPTSSA